MYWRGEVGRDIWSKARITHHLRLVDQNLLYDIQWVLFETMEKVDQESAQETCKQCSLDKESILCNVKGRESYEDKYSIHLFKPFSLSFAVDDFHPYRSHISRFVAMWLRTCLHYSIPRQSWGSSYPLVNTKYEMYS